MINKICLEGKIVTEPKIGKTKNNFNYFSFSLSVVQNSKSTIKQYAYIWCTVFNEDLFNELAGMLKKGDDIYLEGSLNIKENNNNDSEFKTYNFSILVEQIQILNNHQNIKKQQSFKKIIIPDKNIVDQEKYDFVLPWGDE